MNDGVEVDSNFSSINNAEKSMRRPNQDNSQRPEMKGPIMKGPSDISDILSGLKTKPAGQPMSQMQPNFKKVTEANIPTINNNDNIPMTIKKDDDAGSTISIQELKEMQQEGNMPKRSKRRQKSDKSTISLDI